MRIAVGGIATESCTFSPLPTRYEDFKILRGDDLLRRYPFLSEYKDVEFIPLLHAGAIPGGSVEAAAYERIKTEYLDLLRAAGDLDGVYFDMHGAMNVQGMDDAEGDWITTVRGVVGEKPLLAGSFDLHGNITQREVDALNILTAFRTAPHVDYEETRARAVRLLVKCLKENMRPQIARVAIPVVLPGEKTSTEWEPGKSLYASLPEIDAVPGVLEAALFIGYVWADEPRATATAIVTGTDAAAAKAEARKLAAKYWDVREKFRFGVRAASIDECIESALSAPQKPVFISDSGDNPTAGGVGDVPLVLKALIAHDVPDAVLASIADVEAVDACYEAGVGALVGLSLGGKLDPNTAQPLIVTGTVKFLHETKDPLDRQAVVQMGGVQAIITARRRPFHYMEDFRKLGIEPLDHKIVVVKVGYLVPELKAAADLALLALSPGAVDQDIERLPFKRIQRPMYPLDPKLEWSPES